MSNTFTRGSEWRKWDLHIHTPSSYDYGDKSITDEAIIEKLKENSIRVAAITDHHLMDIKKMKRLQELGKDDITILPGVELKAEMRGDEPIHFIGIFPENSDLDYIWGEINSKANIAKQKADRKQDNEIYCDLQDTCKLVKSLGGLVSIHAGSKSNSIEVITNSLPLTMAQKRDIVENIDIFELGKAADANGYRSNVFSQVGIYPMVICSDNHNIRNYELKSNCWIKANPTFEGLKQIIYEPDDRVRIQELRPEEKEMYQLIDKVKFIDNGFMPNKLLINQNLTTIIGGKSTGKSILLRNIAQSVDSSEVAKRLEEGNLDSYDKKVDNFQVVWKDKQESNKEADDVNKKIIYIPQSYLNRLVERDEKRSAVDNIIENVLKQVMGGAYDELSLFERTNNQNIANNIASLFNLKKDWLEQKAKIKNIGDKKGIELELENLERQIVELKKTSGLTDKEITEYDECVNQIKSLTSQIEIINSDKTELEKLKQENIFQEVLFDNLSSNLKDKMETFYKQLKVMVVEKWKIEIDDKIEIQLKELRAKQETLDKIKIKFSPLLERAKKIKALNEKIKQIEIQQGKLKQIRSEEKLLDAIRNRFYQTITTLTIAHSQFYEKYLESKRKILEQDIISGDLTLRLGVQHKTQSFQNDFINEVFNIRQLPAEFSEYEFKNKDGFSSSVEKLINKILNDELVLKGRYTKQETLTKLLQNWYMFDYQIKQGGDKISDMSPGKKSFVLLKLLIELDNSKCPILLDQPEDDLDNRSIYEDLVKFIKNKKKERQFIIVTHNPNLVVGADAECVIVANQEGTYSKNKEYKFEYISGALENTFTRKDESKALYKQGIQEHVCEILEGGEEAFKKRKQRYGK